MLKPIHRLSCSPALRACRKLQEHLTAWLCDPAIRPADLIQGNLIPPRVPTQIEADWLWAFLQRKVDRKPLLIRAEALTAMPAHHKSLLSGWVQAVGKLADQFQPNPPIWPVQPAAIPDSDWRLFKELMEAFYEKGLRAGLPYAEDGTPVAVGGVTYGQFVQRFRDAHRLDRHPHARDVCVVCGGPLADIEVDHWIAKSAYPLLSVCADNLLPVCAKCNSTDNKGSKPVHTNGSFADWFHPYCRHASGGIRLDYDIQTVSIVTSPTNPDDVVKVSNLDHLFNLSERWTTEFKAEYRKQQTVLIGREKRRLNRGQPRLNKDDITEYLATAKEDLVPTEPHYEVHSTLLNALLEQARLDAWQTELGLVK